MSIVRSLLKPCYRYRPGVLVNRIKIALFPSRERTVFVPLPWGCTIEVDLQDAVGREIYKQRLFDIAVSEVLWRLARKGDFVVDAGANIGYMTSLLSAKVGKGGCVHAFEPHPEILPRLKRNITEWQALPGGARIELHELALSDVAGRAELAETGYFGFNQGTASLAKRRQVAHPGEITRSHDVPCATLDELLGDQAVSVLKLDVEGYEINVLKGAEAMLAQGRIRRIVYESHRTEGGEIHDYLRSYRFEVMALEYDSSGVRLGATNALSSLDTSWESPSYLATLEGESDRKVMSQRGWAIFKK